MDENNCVEQFSCAIILLKLLGAFYVFINVIPSGNFINLY